MSCSAAPRDWPFVVFTNSGDDYRVTVRSEGARLRCVEQLVDRIARCCDHGAGGGFPAVIGVVPSPEQAGREVAFRVFDSGSFFNRPHTLAVVAIELPADLPLDGARTRLLAALAPPALGATSYQLPIEEELRAADLGIEPFRSLHAWEELRSAGDGPTAMVCADPPESAGRFREVLATQPPTTTRQQRRRAVVAALSLLLVAAAGGVTSWQLNAARTAPAAMVIMPEFSREELLRCLSDSGVPLSPGGDWANASAAIVATVPALNQRMTALAAELSRRTNDPSGDSEPTLERHYRLWGSPLPVGNLPAERIDNATLAAAVRVHHRYQEVNRALANLEKLDREGDEFARQLADLRRLLAGSVRS